MVYHDTVMTNRRYFRLHHMYCVNYYNKLYYFYTKKIIQKIYKQRKFHGNGIFIVPPSLAFAANPISCLVGPSDMTVATVVVGVGYDVSRWVVVLLDIHKVVI